MPGRPRRTSPASFAASRSGVVFTVAAWNYPYLIAVNSVVPAIMAGNAVVLKHSAQTPLCAERFAECFRGSGLPEGVFQVLHLSHENTERVAKDARIAFVAFTGSVAGGHAIQRAIADRFIGAGLELGGCDPAYVRHDANLAHAIENLVDGAFFNSGQSCCGIQRIYVHEKLHDAFRRWRDRADESNIRSAIPLSRRLHSGRWCELPRRIRCDGRSLRASMRARSLRLTRRLFAASRSGTPYLAPQLLLNAGQGSAVMREEIFGPVAGIQKVRERRGSREAHERQRLRAHGGHLD